MEIENKIKNIICKCSENRVKFNQINNDSNLIEDFNFDSVEMIQLIVELESEFKIIIDEEFLEKEILSSVNELNKIINSLT